MSGTGSRIHTIGAALLALAAAAAMGAVPPADATAPITQAGDYRYTVRHGGLARKYRVHVPPGVDLSKPLPLLVSMHGGGGNMEYQASEERYGQISKSDRTGFVVVFPNGVGALGDELATWNAGRCCGQAKEKNIDDVGFIRLVVSNLKRQLKIDPERVYATGMSNGGMMAHRLACEAPDVFRAVAAVAGTDNTVACSPQRPVSVLQIHARDDDHVPFDGGLGEKSRRRQVTGFTAVPATIARWVERDRCPVGPQRVLEVPGAYCDRHAPCAGGTKVALCVTESGGHSWPGARRKRGGESSKAISANDVMWEFFDGR
ncbi:alpha/beta hydrolase family esterase [Piscinibacter sp.]|uniref:extracellular catalytic domain type 1 short-chain-length polyhydroxyalkanoate depolymerase n=1 Tax=Piscinibacter sp. TaxID=1903157 RepID=UPI0039E5BFFA